MFRTGCLPGPNQVTASNFARQAVLRVSRPALRTPRCAKAQAASTSSRRKEATETLEREPTASADTTHVQVETTPPTQAEHTSNGGAASNNGGLTKTEIEVDSVLAKELSENGTPSLD